MSGVIFQNMQNRISSVIFIASICLPSISSANPAAEIKTIERAAALQDCRNIMQDIGCEVFIGLDKKEIYALMGPPTYPNTGYYMSLGIHFTFNDEGKTNQMSFFGYKMDSSSAMFDGKPSIGLEWGTPSNDAISKLGPPLLKYVSSDFFYLIYKGKLLNYENDRLKSAKLIDAVRMNDYIHWDKIKDSEAASQKAKSEQMAQIEEEFKRIHATVITKTNAANNLIAQHNNNQLDANSGAAIKSDVERIRTEAIKLINDFLAKYQSKLPQHAVDTLINDKAAISSGGIFEKGKPW